MYFRPTWIRQEHFSRTAKYLAVLNTSTFPLCSSNSISQNKNRSRSFFSSQGPKYRFFGQTNDLLYIRHNYIRHQTSLARCSQRRGPLFAAGFNVQCQWCWCTKCAVMNENVQWWKAVFVMMN